MHLQSAFISMSIMSDAYLELLMPEGASQSNLLSLLVDKLKYTMFGSITAWLYQYMCMSKMLIHRFIVMDIYPLYLKPVKAAYLFAINHCWEYYSIMEFYIFWWSQ